ncbi:MAG: DUF1538 domain-containing protein [Clostridia bacterium]|nr:DUF1538 domain-containing protein [Clostridia bacterium]
MTQLREKLREALSSVVPITAIVLILSITIAPVETGVMVLFLFGALMLIFGMSLFTLGAGLSMQPMGEGVGVQLSKSRRIWLSMIICFALGVIITIAEPDLQVLAQQIPSVPNMVLILTVAVGVGVFLVIALLRMVFGIPLARLLLIFYVLVFVLAIFVPADFLPAAYDSGGVTTGPITVPFIMALGVGMAAIRSDKRSAEDSFGLVALCSIGPILAVMILSLFFKPEASASENVIAEVKTTLDAIRTFTVAIPHYAGEVLTAFLPIVGVFLLFQLLTRRFRPRQLLRMCMGFLYTYIGLVLFLCGANVGFMPAGQLIGGAIAGGKCSVLLIPVGMLVGYFIVAAEPAVHVLKKQVEEISNGQISQRSIGLGLSIGVAVSVGIAMLRILTGVSILPFLLVGYALSLTISFFVPPLYTGVAFDSGGVASGPMTTAFLLPFALGACTALGGNLLTDAFGIVAMVAMTPLITIQSIGLFSVLRSRAAQKKAADLLSREDDGILYYTESEEI